MRERETETERDRGRGWCRVGRSLGSSELVRINKLGKQKSSLNLSKGGYL